ncbi:MAG: hypothetical protein WC827_02345 [Candidatus Paceibacterota bacterium]|jgi:hypothetical protein
MSWAQRRKATYTLGFLVIIILIFVFIFLKFFNKQQTCFDGIKNQNELGIDCGGQCTILCRAQYTDPTVLWTRWSKVTNAGTYNVLIYIQNSNLGIGAYKAPYSLSIYDKDNILLYSKKDYTYIPPSNNFTIFESDININDKIPARIDFTFSTGFIWQKIENEELNIVAISKVIVDEDIKPKLLVTLKNKSLKEIDNIESVAILYDEDANAIAFSKTKIDLITKDNTEDIVFTWPEKFEKKIYKIDVISKVIKSNVN